MTRDDNREWTVRVLPGRLGASFAHGPVTLEAVPVVPRSRLEQVEAERDALAAELDNIIGGAT